MNINKINYAAYIVDFYEGNLTSLEQDMLFDFLNIHPYLMKEFNEFELIKLNVDPIAYPHKNSLHRKKVFSTTHINEFNFDEKMIEFYESDSFVESDELMDFLNSNDHLKNDFLLYEKCFLESKDIIEYPFKNELKRKDTPIISFISFVKVAAIIIIVLGLSFILNNHLSTTTFLGYHSHLNNNEILPGFDSEINNTELFQPTHSSTFDGDLQEVNVKFNTEVKIEKIDPIPPLKLISGIIQLSSNENVLVAISNRTFKYSNLEMMVNSQVRTPNNFAGQVLDRLSPFFLKKYLSRQVEKKSFVENLLEGYNVMADRNIQIKRVIDSEGNIKGIHLVENNEMLAGLSKNE